MTFHTQSILLFSLKETSSTTGPYRPVSIRHFIPFLTSALARYIFPASFLSLAETAVSKPPGKGGGGEGYLITPWSVSS